MIGIVLLVLTMLLSFTGYLLPWISWLTGYHRRCRDGRSSFVGKQVNIALLGGFEIGQATLIAGTLCVIFLPLLLIVVVSMHFWRVRKDGNISTPIYPAEAAPEEVRRRLQGSAPANDEMA